MRRVLSFKALDLQVANMRFEKPGYLRSLVVSKSFGILSAVTPKGFDERVITLSPAALKVITQQNYEVPPSETTPEYAASSYRDNVYVL